MHTERWTPVARGQHGLVTTGQLAESGTGPDAVTRLLRRGLLVRLRRGVYAVAGAPATPEQPLMAAVLAAGRSAVASHRAAAWLWGLAGEPVAEVTVPPSRSVRVPGVVVHRAEVVDPVVRRGVPTSNPLSAVRELAAVAPLDDVHRALDQGLALRLFSAEAVAAELGRCRRKGLPGVCRLDEALRWRVDGEERGPSVLQARMGRLLRRAGLPAPVAEHWVLGGRYRVDFAYPPRRVAIEVDGYAHHSSLDAFRNDRRRQNQLVAEGWTVLRFSWDDVCGRPEGVATEVRAVLCADPVRRCE